MRTIDQEVRKVVQDLRSAYVPNDAYHKLERYFRMLVDQRRADMRDGTVMNLRGIVLIGRSGSGKTSAMRELARRNADLLQWDREQEICEFVGMQVPSPATMKVVGGAVLSALGYPLARDKSASAIWEMVKQQLRFRQTLFLHMDEAQDLTRFQTEGERRSVVNTLKSLMENSQWPVGLILSGTPELKTIINQDPQLSRRIYPIEIERLNEFVHISPVIDLVQRYAKRASIPVEGAITNEGFARRLLHAADYEFGLMAEFIVQSISAALTKEDKERMVKIRHFADVFHMRSGAIDGLNPFLAEDFLRIDSRQVLGE